MGIAQGTGWRPQQHIREGPMGRSGEGTQSSRDSYLLTGQVLLELLQLLLLALNLQLHFTDGFSEASATGWRSLDQRITAAVAIFVWPNYVSQGALPFVRVPSKLEGESWTRDSYVKKKGFELWTHQPMKRAEQQDVTLSPLITENTGGKPAEFQSTLYRRLPHGHFTESWGARGNSWFLIFTHLFLAKTKIKMNVFKKYKYILKCDFTY